MVWILLDTTEDRISGGVRKNIQTEIQIKVRLQIQIGHKRYRGYYEKYIISITGVLEGTGKGNMMEKKFKEINWLKISQDW